MASKSEDSRGSPSKETGNLEEYEVDGLSSPRCACFCFPWRAQLNEHVNLRYRCIPLPKQQGEEEDEVVIRESWMMMNVKRIKEVSEVLAGPIWKNLIQRFSKVRGLKSKKKMQFQYDPKSYALNFDDDQVHLDGATIPNFVASRSSTRGMVINGQLEEDLTNGV